MKQVPDDTVSLDESLSPAEQAATAAEVFALSSAEQSEQAYATLLKLAALEFDSIDGWDLSRLWVWHPDTGSSDARS